MALNGMDSCPQVRHKKMMYNSTSSVHVAGTISNPDRVSTLICIGLLLQGRVLKDLETSPVGNIDSEFNLIPNLLPEFGGLEPLDEISLSKLESDARGNRELLEKLKSGSVPMSSSIVGFIGMLQYTTDSPLECVIIAYMYLNRILKASSMVLTFQNWRMLWTMAFILAHKAWNEKPEPLSTFTLLLAGVSKQQLKSLERKVLQMIDYNTSCSHKDYVKQYFELYIAYLNEIRTLDAFIVWRFKPLTPLGAKRLELRSSSLYKSHSCTPGGNTRKADAASFKQAATATGGTDAASAKEDLVVTGGTDAASAKGDLVVTGGTDAASAKEDLVVTGGTDAASAKEDLVLTGGTDAASAKEDLVVTGGNEGASAKQTMTATGGNGGASSTHAVVALGVTEGASSAQTATAFAGGDVCMVDVATATVRVDEALSQTVKATRGDDCEVADEVKAIFAPANPITLSASTKPFVPQRVSGIDECNIVTDVVADESHAAATRMRSGLSSVTGSGGISGGEDAAVRFAGVAEEPFPDMKKAVENFAAAALAEVASYGPVFAPTFNPQQYRDWTELTGEELQRMSEEAAQGAPGGGFPVAQQHNQHLFHDAHDHIHYGQHDAEDGGDDEDDDIDLHAVDDDSEMGYMLRRQQFERDEEECERMDREWELRCMFDRGPGQPMPTRRWSFDGATEGEHFRFVLN